MEKKYQLVAWTKNITDKENARLYVVPSVMCDLIEPLLKEVTQCRKKQAKDGGHISLELARRFIKVYEQSAELEILTGNIDQAIRFFMQAAYDIEYSINLVSKCCQNVVKFRFWSKRKSPKSLIYNNLGDFRGGA